MYQQVNRLIKQSHGRDPHAKYIAEQFLPDRVGGNLLDLGLLKDALDAFVKALLVTFSFVKQFKSIELAKHGCH